MNVTDAFMTYCRTVLPVLLAIVFCQSSFPLPAAADTSTTADPVAAAKMLKGEVDTKAYNSGPFTRLTGEAAKALGFAYSSAGSTNLPATLSRVDPGSPAAAAGLRAGDLIRFASFSNNAASLIMDRKGTFYQTKLPCRTQAVAPVTQLSQSTQSSPPPQLSQSTAGTLHSGKATLDEQLAVLAQHKVAIIIDRSGSMSTQDCPGGVSRWQWCAEQTANLTHQTAACLSHGLTIMTFANDFNEMDGVTGDQVAQIFSSNRPDGGTRTDEPLRHLLANYLSSRGKQDPLAIAVITDGQPNYPADLEKVILDATHMMSAPNQVSITFLKVGEGTEGDQLLSQMDQDLAAAGAKYNIVDHKDFFDLQSEGLIGALVESITQPHPVSASASGSAPAPGGGGSVVYKTGTSPSAVASYAAYLASQQQKIGQAQQERSDMERQLLGR